MAHGRNTKTHLIVDQRRQRQVVKQVGEVLPHVGIAVLSQTFIIEAVAERKKQKNMDYLFDHVETGQNTKKLTLV
jgi:hypothetical protein